MNHESMPKTCTEEPVQGQSEAKTPAVTKRVAFQDRAGVSPVTVSSGCQSEGSSVNFASHVDQLDVVELELVVAPRDVHSHRGVWMVNQKVRKGAEVCLRKLNESDKLEFEKAMEKEIQSYLDSQAVQICEAHGVPPERIMGMRWIYTWKAECDLEGKQTGRKAKARLIVKGFQDPRLTELPREAPTLSTLGRNAILSQASRCQTTLLSGDIKTAFLQGDASEVKEDIYGLPPPEV